MVTSAVSLSDLPRTEEFLGIKRTQLKRGMDAGVSEKQDMEAFHVSVSWAGQDASDFLDHMVNITSGHATLQVNYCAGMAPQQAACFDLLDAMRCRRMGPRCWSRCRVPTSMATAAGGWLWCD